MGLSDRAGLTKETPGLEGWRELGRLRGRVCRAVKFRMLQESKRVDVSEAGSVGDRQPHR